MVDIKKFEASVGITLFRQQININFTPCVWRKLYVFVPDKSVKSYTRENSYTMFAGPFHLWNFEANDMFKVSLDFSFKALEYVPKACYGSKRIL